MIPLTKKPAQSYPHVSLIRKKLPVIIQDKIPTTSPIEQFQMVDSNLLSTINSPFSPSEQLPPPNEMSTDITECSRSLVEPLSLTNDCKEVSTASTITDQSNQSNLSNEHPFNDRTNRKKVISRVIVVALILIVCLVGVIVPIILVRVLQQNKSDSSSATYIIASFCPSKTCIGNETPYRTSIITALYPLDYNTNDLSGYNTGIASGLAPLDYTPVTSYVRQAIGFNSISNQYIRIPNINFKQQSFTIQLWYFIMNGGSSVDYALFSQCSLDSICFSLSIRNSRVTLSFDSLNTNASILTGTTLLSINTWQHVTVVYDATIYQQLIYINGRTDAISYGLIKPFQGSSVGASTYIGFSSSVNYSSSYFHGYMDHVTISAGVARTSCQIYNDATLIAYYPFDTTDTLLDRGVNLFHGIASDIQIVSSGRLQQAISFNLNTSYFQAPCYPTLRTGGLPLSLTLWINPTTVIGGGSIIHLSNLQNGAGALCYDLLGFTATGVLTAQLMRSSGAPPIYSIESIVLPLNTWTHLAIVYASTNGFRFFINGQLFGSIQMTLDANSANFYITLGNNSPGLSTPASTCSNPSIAAGSYKGAIDEFRIYNRELDSQELCVLANI